MHDSISCRRTHWHLIWINFPHSPGVGRTGKQFPGVGFRSRNQGHTYTISVLAFLPSFNSIDEPFLLGISCPLGFFWNMTGPMKAIHCSGRKEETWILMDFSHLTQWGQMQLHCNPHSLQLSLSLAWQSSETMRKAFCLMVPFIIMK